MAYAKHKDPERPPDRPANDDDDAEAVRAEAERWELLANLHAMFDRPLIGLSIVWLILLVLDLTAGLGPVLRGLTYGIWALFILDALIEIAIAPDRLGHIRRRWYIFISLAVPAFRPLTALRAFRLLRTIRIVRAVGLARILSGLNRGFRSVRDVGESKGIGYVVALTVVVLFGGAAGMYWLEGIGTGAASDSPFDSFADAVWWTAMLLTTIGTDFFPTSVEGRILAWLLALYGLAVFGYLTAAVATYFIGRDRATHQARESDLDRLRSEIATLNRRLATLNGDTHPSPRR